MTEKQYKDMMAMFERMATGFEQTAKSLLSFAQTVNKQNELLERIAKNTEPGTRRLTK